MNKPCRALLSSLLLSCAVSLAQLVFVANAAEPQVAVEAAARWHINYSSYLVDVGKYFEAVEQYDTAFDLSQIDKTRGTALMGKAMVLSTYLDAPDKTAEIYETIQREYPFFAENAAYRLGFLFMEIGDNPKAQQLFGDYLKRFPQGQFRFQVEALLEQVRSRPTKPSPQPQETPPAREQPRLRVRLLGKNTMLTVKADTSKVCADGLGCAQSYTIRLVDGRISINGRTATSGEPIFKSNGNIKVGNGKDEKTVRGDVKIVADKDRLLAVNLVDMEDYLLSVVPAESYASWHIEALKAQATAARTYAYYQKLHRKHLPYDLVDNTGDQMYSGVKRETDKTNRAVRATSGMVIYYGDKPILSQYTANSGGTTADAGAIFGVSKPYLVSHPDPASLQGKMSTWRRSFSAHEIENALAARGINTPGISAIEPIKRGPSGRITRIRIRYSSGTRELNTRTQFASSRVLKLPEILLELQQGQDGYSIEGHGHGHGVGYSQWGAAELAKTKGYADVLGFYYPGTTLKKMW